MVQCVHRSLLTNNFHNKMSQVMSDSRTSDLIMSLLHQNDIEAEVPEVKGIVMAERILVKGLEKLCKMIELGTTHEELVLQWQGINRFIDLYLKRKDDIFHTLLCLPSCGPSFMLLMQIKSE